jgi:2-aminobenzoylacetyl-CoA thioesterase
MIHLSNPGRVIDSFHCLGPVPVPSFLLDGERPAVFDAGIYHFGPEYIRQIRSVLGDREPAYLFLTHMHFDHCGAAGYLKRHFPGMVVCSSAEGAEIIKKPSAIELIAKLNRFGKHDEVSFEPFTVDHVLEDDECFNISGNLSIRAMRAPGHTRDLTAYYIPEMRILLPSESAGVPGADGYIFSEFLIDYNMYLDSLKKLSGLAIDTLVCAHGVYFTGNEAMGFIRSSLEQTEKFRERIEELIRIHGDDDETIMKIIRGIEYDVIEGNNKQPERAYLINLAAKIKVVRRLTAKKN